MSLLEGWLYGILLHQNPSSPPQLTPDLPEFSNPDSAMLTFYPKNLCLLLRTLSAYHNAGWRQYIMEKILGRGRHQIKNGWQGLTLTGVAFVGSKGWNCLGFSNAIWSAPVGSLWNFGAYGTSAGRCYFKVFKSHYERVPLVSSWNA